MANQCLEIREAMGALTLTERPLPEAPPRGFVLKTHFAGICHSDVHLWKNKMKVTEELSVGIEMFKPDFVYPHVLGHEISGEIHALGKDYTGPRRVGERVAVYPWLGCEACDHCRVDEPALCPASTANTLGVGEDGGFQSYVAVPDGKFAVPVPAGVPMDTACLFGCSALTAYNAVQKVKQSVVNAVHRSGRANLLVIGAGGLGLWVIQWAKALLPEGTKVYAADITVEKLQMAEERGVDGTIVWSLDATDEELIAKTKEVTGGGIDASIDLVGIPATVNRAFNSANKDATLALVGLAGGVMMMPMFPLIANAITVVGIYVGLPELMKEMMEEFSKGKVQPPPISAVKPQEAEKYLHGLMKGTVTGRTVIDFIANDTK